MLKLITETTKAAEEATAVTATLDDLARVGAQRMIAAALQIEVDDYLARFRDARDAAGHARVVRNGTARARPDLPGVRPLTIAAPRGHDRRVIDGVRQKYTSALLPPNVERRPRVATGLQRLPTHQAPAGAGAGGRGRGAGIVGGGARGLAGDGGAALLGASPRERAGQAPEESPAARAPGAARNHVRRDAGGRRARDRALRAGVRRQVSQGRRVADRRSGPPPGVLRLPGGTLEASAHDESDRVHVLDGSRARRRDEGRRLPDRRAGDGVQAAARGRRSLAQRRCGRARPARARRRLFRGRSADRASEDAEEGRRLIFPQSTTLDDGSSHVPVEPSGSPVENIRFFLPGDKRPNGSALGGRRWQLRRDASQACRPAPGMARSPPRN